MTSVIDVIYFFVFIFLFIITYYIVLLLFSVVFYLFIKSKHEKWIKPINDYLFRVSTQLLRALLIWGAIYVLQLPSNVYFTFRIIVVLFVMFFWLIWANNIFELVIAIWKIERDGSRSKVTASTSLAATGVGSALAPGATESNKPKDAASLVAIGDLADDDEESFNTGLSFKPDMASAASFDEAFRMAKWFSYLFIVMLCFSAMGVNLLEFLDAINLYTLGIAIAFQPFFQSSLAGLLIFAGDYLNFGERVRSMGKEGYVDMMRLRFVRLFDPWTNSHINIPTNMLADVPLADFSRRKMQSIEVRILFERYILVECMKKIIEELNREIHSLHPDICGHILTTPRNARGKDLSKLSGISTAATDKLFLVTMDSPNSILILCGTTELDEVSVRKLRSELNLTVMEVLKKNELNDNVKLLTKAVPFRELDGYDEFVPVDDKDTFLEHSFSKDFTESKTLQKSYDDQGTYFSYLGFDETRVINGTIYQ